MKSQDVILGILREAPSSGYEIKQKLEQLFSHFYNASYGTIYPTLRTMEQAGLITKTSYEQEGRPTKHLYAITPKGEQEFAAYLASDIQDVEVKSDLMVRLYFGAYAEPALVEEWLVSTLRRTEATYARLSAEYAKWEPRLTPTQRICMKIGVTNTENLMLQLREGLTAVRAAPQAETAAEATVAAEAKE